MLPPAVIMLHPHFTLPGGAGRTLLEVGARLAKTRTVVIIAQRIDAAVIEQFPTIEFISTHGPLTSQFAFWLLWPLWYIKVARQIKRYRRTHSVTLYCGVFPAQWFGFVYAWLHPAMPCVWYCHEPSAFIHVPAWRKAIPSPLKRTLAALLAPGLALLDRWLAQQADTIFVHTPYNAQVIKQVYGRTSVIAPPGVTLSLYQPIPFAQKQRLILAVGRLTQFKRYDILVRAFAALADPTVHLCLVGDGEEKITLQQLINSLGIANRANIISGLSDIDLRTLYAQALLLVSCAQAEPYGLTVLEAQASGTAVIADASGGTTYIVNPGKTGLTIDCTVENLTATLRQVLADPDTLEQWSKAAPAWVADRFTWDATADIIQQTL